MLFSFFSSYTAEQEEFFQNMIKLVETAYETNGNTPVTLIGHSMGANFLLILLQRQSDSWKAQYIKSFVTLGAPWGGSMLPLKLLAVGKNIDISSSVEIRPKTFCVRWQFRNLCPEQT